MTTLISLLSNVFDKLCLIIAFSFIANILNYSNFIELLAHKTKKINTVPKLIIFWYVISFVLSGFFNDMTAALLIIPIAIEYCNKVHFYYTEVLVTSIVFGIASGGDITVFGGNDNLSALALMQGTVYEISKLEWTKIFIIPTLLIGVIALLISLYMSKDCEWHCTQNNTITQEKVVIKTIPFIVSIGLIVCAFYLKSYIVLILSLIAVLAFKIFNIKDLPLKAMGFWTLSFLVGKTIGKFIPTLTISHNWLLYLGLAGGTNIFTNTALMSGILPVLIKSNVPIYVCYTAIKAINLAYISIYGNNCYALAAGYGVSQKNLIKYGAPILVLSYGVVLLFSVALKAFI